MSEPLDEPRHRSWYWPFGLGAFLFALGLMCFYRVYFGTDLNQMLIGVFMLIGGVAEGLHAIFGRAWRDFITDLAPALLYVLSGLIIVSSPITGTFVLTLVLTAALVTGAVYRLMASWRDRALSAWQTLAVAAVVSIAVWLFLLWTWPSSGLWVLGSVAGIGLFVTGYSWVQRGLQARRLHEAM